VELPDIIPQADPDGATQTANSTDLKLTAPNWHAKIQIYRDLAAFMLPTTHKQGHASVPSWPSAVITTDPSKEMKHETD
jgi:hypothetical protein